MSKILYFMGDSLTMNYTCGTLAHEQYPAVIERLLTEAGADVICRNFGISGNTTSQSINRVNTLYNVQNNNDDNYPTYETPDLVCFLLGTNDTDTTTVTENQMRLIRAIQNKVKGTVATQSFLPNKGLGDELIPLGTKYFVWKDTSTDGGLSQSAAPTWQVQPATLTGTNTASGSVWIKRQHQTGSYGWSRIADNITGAPYVIPWTMMWTMLTGSGDTVDSPIAATMTLTASQKQAADACNVPIFDLYAYQKQRVVNGFSTARSGEWCCLPNDRHPNAEGARVMAVAFLDWAYATTMPSSSTTWYNWMLS